MNTLKNTSGINTLPQAPSLREGARPLPPGWRWVPLRELATYQNGRAFKPEDWSRHGLPIVRIENLTNPEAPYNYYLGEVEDRHLIDMGDLLLSWSASLDAFLWERGEAVLNQHIFKVCENEAKVTRGFLFYLLCATMDRIRAEIHGATMQHITKPKFEAILVPVPSDIEEQKAISARLQTQLSKVQGMGQAAERQLKAARQLRFRIVAQAMTDVGNADGYLHEVLKSPPKGGWSPPYTGQQGSTPVLTLSAVLNFRYDGTQVKLTSMPVDERADYWAKKDDIFISRSNTPDLVGHAALCDGTPERAIFSDLLIRLEVDKSLANVQFVHYWLMTPTVRNFIVSQARGSSGTMKKITRGMIREIPFPAHLAVQQQETVAKDIEQRVSMATKVLPSAERQLEAINALPGAILREVFGGYAYPPAGSEPAGG